MRLNHRNTPVHASPACALCPTRKLLCTVGALAVVPAFVSEVRAEKYPRMVSALGELKEARREMKDKPLICTTCAACLWPIAG